MNIHIDKTGDFGFVTTKEAFHGRILGRNRREIATIEYDNSTQRAKQRLKHLEEQLNARETEPSFKR